MGVVAALRVDCPSIDQCCALRVLAVDVRTHRILPEDVDNWFGTMPAATSIYVCCGDDDANLAVSKAEAIRKFVVLTEDWTRSMPSPPFSSTRSPALSTT